MARRWRGQGDDKFNRDRRADALRKGPLGAAHGVLEGARRLVQVNAAPGERPAVIYPSKQCPECAWSTGRVEVTIERGDEPARFACPSCKRGWVYKPRWWKYVPALLLMVSTLGLVGCGDDTARGREIPDRYLYLRDSQGRCLMLDTHLSTSGTQYSQWGDLRVYECPQAEAR